MCLLLLTLLGTFLNSGAARHCLLALGSTVRTMEFLVVCLVTRTVMVRSVLFETLARTFLWVVSAPV